MDDGDRFCGIHSIASVTGKLAPKADWYIAERLVVILANASAAPSAASSIIEDAFGSLLPWFPHALTIAVMPFAISTDRAGVTTASRRGRTSSADAGPVNSPTRPSARSPPSQARRLADSPIILQSLIDMADAVPFMPAVLIASLTAAVVAAALLRYRNKIYRRLYEEETADAESDGIPDIYQKDRAEGTASSGRT
ncbi:hypothetical protein [Streptomyces virginiae]|uniref:hypothetical protein n=1 Tax=Streptomyces virginiae TaxID=1961 RepID=UPI0035D6BB0D